MKKLLSIILLISISYVSQAQVTMAQTDPAGAAATVNTNADTSYHTIALTGNTNNFNDLNFTIKGTKTSGTVAGAVTLWGSSGNGRWYPVYGASTSAMADTVTTQSLTDASVDLQFLVYKTRYAYYRVRVITSGTQVSSYVCQLTGRKVAN
jgi:hypothetical protein